MRRISTVSLAVLAVIALWLTAQQSLAGSQYRDDPRNARSLPDPDDTARGPIASADGATLAVDEDGVRTYPSGGDYLHSVGIASEDLTTGVESTRSTDLRSLDDGSLTSWLVRVFGGSVEPPEVRLTIHDRLQQVAMESLRGHTGAIIALDPATGAVVAYASTPTVDPNDVVSGELLATRYASDEASLDRVAFRLLPSGSTFKVLVAAAALEAGLTQDSVLVDRSEYLAPGAGQPITNVGGSTCTPGDEITLRDALEVSCNTAFAELAVELGGGPINAIAERAGLNSILPFELGAAVSSIPDAEDLDADPGALAQTGIGERDIRVTPLQMAVITAAIANGGELMAPYLVDAVVSRDGTTLDSTEPMSLGTFVDDEIAGELLSMMEEVVLSGTGRAAAVSGVTVAGKTGTAEGGGGPHSWFVAVAPSEAASIALAIVIEGEGTGGTVAAPIAADLIAEWMDR